MVPSVICANRVSLRVDMHDGRGYLVLADAYSDGWTVTIDGSPGQILPADLAMRALPLREGVHEVVFTYAPWSWRFGLPLLSFGALLGLGCAVVMYLKRR